MRGFVVESPPIRDSIEAEREEYSYFSPSRSVSSLEGVRMWEVKVVTVVRVVLAGAGPVMDNAVVGALPVCLD